jgi:hypothetical protein
LKAQKFDLSEFRSFAVVFRSLCLLGAHNTEHSKAQAMDLNIA